MISVQELVKLGPIITIPQQFVRLNQEPSSFSFTSTPLPATPTIDMARLVSGDDQNLELQKLHSTCKDWGLFQVLLHSRFSFIRLIIINVNMTVIKRIFIYNNKKNIY